MLFRRTPRPKMPERLVTFRDYETAVRALGIKRARIYRAGFHQIGVEVPFWRVAAVKAALEPRTVLGCVTHVEALPFRDLFRAALIVDATA